MNRRKFTDAFKAKAVMESLKEHSSVNEIAAKHKISPQQLSNWKRAFVANAESVFSSPSKDTKSDEEKEKDKLLRTIGELKVENDFLKKNLR